MTPEEYKIRFDFQEGKCCICEKVAKLVVDHDHKTGKVRGLLCHKCNSLVGFACDNSMVLSRASLYIDNFNQFGSIPFRMESSILVPSDDRDNLSDEVNKNVTLGLNDRIGNEAI